MKRNRYTRLSLLGKSESKLPASPARAKLETFDNPEPKRDYWISLACRQFSSLCPITGQPDFANITVEYIPDKVCVETKSWKFYLASFRNEKAFNEEIVNRILNDFVKACRPRRAIVRGEFADRGGIGLSVEAQYPDELVFY